jgi:hypothetical protein
MLEFRGADIDSSSGRGIISKGRQQTFRFPFFGFKHRERRLRPCLSHLGLYICNNGRECAPPVLEISVAVSMIALVEVDL